MASFKKAMPGHRFFVYQSARKLPFHVKKRLAEMLERCEADEIMAVIIFSTRRSGSACRIEAAEAAGR